MGKYLNPGNYMFEAVRKGYYVDKTMMIEEINHNLGTAQKLTCITRPRRFGKSFAANMLCAYYDKTCDSDDLFSNLAIAACADYAATRNRYNVIYLDITGFFNAPGASRVSFVSSVDEDGFDPERRDPAGLYFHNQNGKPYGGLKAGEKFRTAAERHDRRQ